MGRRAGWLLARWAAEAMCSHALSRGSVAVGFACCSIVCDRGAQLAWLFDLAWLSVQGPRDDCLARPLAGLFADVAVSSRLCFRSFSFLCCSLSARWLIQGWPLARVLASLVVCPPAALLPGLPASRPCCLVHFCVFLCHLASLQPQWPTPPRFTVSLPTRLHGAAHCCLLATLLFAFLLVCHQAFLAARLVRWAGRVAGALPAPHLARLPS